MTEYHVQRSALSHFMPDEVGLNVEIVVTNTNKSAFRDIGYGAMWMLPVLQVGRVIEVLPDGTAWVELSWEPPQELWAATRSVVGSGLSQCVSRPSTTNPPTLPSAAPRPVQYAWLTLNGQAVGEVRAHLSLDSGRTTHAYDGTGSLLCSRCAAPYPYAEPPKSGPFVCYGCKVVM